MRLNEVTSARLPCQSVTRDVSETVEPSLTQAAAEHGCLVRTINVEIGFEQERNVVDMVVRF